MTIDGRDLGAPIAQNEFSSGNISVGSANAGPGYQNDTEHILQFHTQGSGDYQVVLVGPTGKNFFVTSGGGFFGVSKNFSPFVDTNNYPAGKPYSNTLFAFVSPGAWNWRAPARIKP